MTEYVHLITETESLQLKDQIFKLENYFNPIQDFYNNWVISIKEVDECVNTQFLWVKDTPLIIYVPKERVV